MNKTMAGAVDITIRSSRRLLKLRLPTSLTTNLAAGRFLLFLAAGC
jgi:hypothetical protein